MRELVLKMSLSVDGFVGGPNGEVDWIFKSLDQEATAWTVATLREAGVHVMGSRTFRDMAAYWPAATDAFAAPMNEIPKVVFSRKPSVAEILAGPTTRAVEDASRAKSAQCEPPAVAAAPGKDSWAGATVACGALSEEVARLKRQPGGPILAHGGAGFAQSLVRLGLVDEYRLVIHPEALGRGLALFSGLSGPLELSLLSATPFPGGAVAKVYRPAR